jgi:hypothetical protein
VTTTSRSDRRRPWRLVAVGTALALALGAIPGCSSCRSSKSKGASGAPASLAPVPAPRGLMAELFIPKPTQTWTALRNLVGGPTLLLPSTYPMLASTLLGLPNDVAGHIDSHIPVVGILLDAGKGHPVAVVGLHVVSGRELVADLTTGKNAKYRSRVDPASGVVVLEAVPGKAPEDVSLGVVGNYLLVSDNSEHLVTGGPYVARTLPKRSMPPDPVTLIVPKQALSGPIAAQLEQAWSDYRARLQASKQVVQAQHGGRPADFANPAVALSGASGAVTGLIDVLGSADELQLAVEPTADHLEARLELQPGKSGAAEQFVHGMTTGSAKPLLDLPLGTAFALLERTSASSRKASSQSTRDAIENLLGARLDAAARKQLEQTLADLAQGRGDVLAYALVFNPGHASATLESTVADPKALKKGVQELIGLLRVPAFAAPIEEFIGHMTLVTSTTHLHGVTGPVNQVLVQVTPSHPSPTLPKPFSCLWTIQDGTLYATLGRDSDAVLPELVAAAHDPQSSLSADATVAAAVKPAQDTSFAVLVDPLKLGLIGSSSQGSAPVLLSVGETSGQGVVRLHVAKSALEGSVRALMNRR